MTTYTINGQTFDYPTADQQRAAIAEANRREREALVNISQRNTAAGRNAKRLLSILDDQVEQCNITVAAALEQAAPLLAEPEAPTYEPCMMADCADPVATDALGYVRSVCEVHLQAAADYKESLLRKSQEAGLADPYYRRAAAANHYDWVEARINHIL